MVSVTDAGPTKATPKTVKRKLRSTGDKSKRENGDRFNALSDAERKVVGVLHDLLPGSEERDSKAMKHEESDDAATTVSSGSMSTERKSRNNKNKGGSPAASDNNRGGSTAYRRKSNCHYCEPLMKNCGLVAGKCPNRPCTSCGGRHRLGRCKKLDMSLHQPVNGPMKRGGGALFASTPVSSATMSPAESPTTSPSPSPSSESSKFAPVDSKTFLEPPTPLGIGFSSTSTTPNSRVNKPARPFSSLGGLENQHQNSNSAASKPPSNQHDMPKAKPARLSRKPQLRLDISETTLSPVATLPQSASSTDFSGFNFNFQPLSPCSSSPSTADFLRNSGLLGGIPSPTNFSSFFSPMSSTTNGNRGCNENGPSFGTPTAMQSHGKGPSSNTMKFHGDQVGSHFSFPPPSQQPQYTPMSQQSMMHHNQGQVSSKNSDSMMGSFFMPMQTPSGFSFPFNFPLTPLGNCNTPIGSNNGGIQQSNADHLAPLSPSSANGNLSSDDLISAQSGIVSLATPRLGGNQNIGSHSMPEHHLQPPTPPQAMVRKEQSAPASFGSVEPEQTRRSRPALSIDTQIPADISRGKKGSPKNRQYTMLRKKSACHFCSEIGKNCGLVAGKCPNRPCAKCNGRHRHGRCRLRSFIPQV